MVVDTSSIGDEGRQVRRLRRAVIFRKLSFGTESGSGSKSLAVVMSVLETCRHLGRHALTWLTTAVTQHLSNHPAPTLLGVG